MYFQILVEDRSTEILIRHITEKLQHRFIEKKAAGSYSEIGKAKCEWADKIGRRMDLEDNKSPSYRRFTACLLKETGEG